MGRPGRADSPAALEAREAARTAKLDALHSTLTAQIAALRTGQDWQRWLTVAARFHNYSFNNVLLIAAQRPDATAVAGYEAWRALGRQVDKGERGMQVLAPVVRRTASADPPGAEAAAAPDSQTSDQTGDDLQERASGAGARRVAGFRVAHVFDVTQTSGAPLPERPVPRLLAGQAPSGLWDVLAEQVQARGFTVKRGPCLGCLANGLTNYRTRTVTVRADVDDAQAVKTLAHELAHVLLHDPAAGAAAGPGDPHTAGTADSAGQCRGRVEVEAESVAYLVTASHGLDSGAYTFPYVAGWAGSMDAVTPETVVRATGQRVLTAAHVILKATEHLHTLDGPTADVALTQAQVVEQVLDSDPVQLHERAERGAQQSAALRGMATHAEQAASLLADGVRSVAAPTFPAPRQLSVPRPGTGPGPARLREVHDLATAYYRAQLCAPGESRRATELLTRRGVDRDTAVAEGMGYAPRAWTRLLEHLRGAGVGTDELLASGLAMATSRGTLVDRFRDRLIFPVRDGTGRTVALLGRAVDPTATDRSGHPVPKYLNSPDTDLYRKGQVLYGLDDKTRAALAAGAVPVLVEGPMDVRAINLAGATLAAPPGEPAFVGVAPCGTALTAEQVSLLDTATGGLAGRGVVVSFDADNAGRAAAVCAFELLRAVAAWPHAVDLPNGQDPAGLLQQRGSAAVHAALRAAAVRPLADLVVDERLNRYTGQLQWAEGKVAAARAAAQVVATMPTEHIGRQIARLVTRLDLPAGEVSDLVVDAITSPSRSATATASRRPAGPTPPTSTADTPAAERAPASQSAPTAAQRARAGFPLPLTSHLRRSAATPTAAGMPTADSPQAAGPPPTAAVRRHA